MTGENAGMFAQAREGLFWIVLIVLGLLFFACLIRAVKGPRVADRLVSVNMIGTMVMVMIAVLSLLLGEDYLLDICLIYAMASFLAVIVLAKVYIGIYEEQRLNRDGPFGESPDEAAKETVKEAAKETVKEAAKETEGKGDKSR